MYIFKVNLIVGVGQLYSLFPDFFVECLHFSKYLNCVGVLHKYSFITISSNKVLNQVDLWQK